ncbi:hypothetical protein [Rugamonas fusca]|uniref:hypothetical protein n=1 Tax=Rugamonas fusca TaxID=2758568 RepID=UPI001E4C53FE|nr:hypothetical protein [Rugamonas fusca]
MELIEECPGCGKKLNWHRPTLLNCACGFPLSTASAVPCSTADKTLSQLFHAKLHRLLTSRRHLSELSLEQLNKVTFMLGAYAKHEGRKFSQKISNLHDIAVARPLVSAAAEILTHWPHKFHGLLASLRKTGEIDVQDERLSKRFGFFYHYVYRNLKDPEYSFLLQAFEGYISRTWRGSLAERNSRFSSNMRHRHTWIPISLMAKELKTTSRQIQLLIDQGKVECYVHKTPKGRSLKCVSRKQNAEIRKALENVIDFKQTYQLLGLTKSRAMQLINGKMIQSIFQPKNSSTSRWGIPHDHVIALLSFASHLPVVDEKDRTDLISLGYALRYWLRERYLFPALVLAVIHKGLCPVAVSNSTFQLPTWLFDRTSLLNWIQEQRQVSMEGFLSVPDTARKLGIRQQAVYSFIYSSKLRFVLHYERHHVLVYEKDIEKFSEDFVFCHELEAQFSLIPAYFVPRLIEQGIRPVSTPKIDKGEIFLFSRDHLLFAAMDRIVAGRKCTDTSQSEHQCADAVDCASFAAHTPG